MFLCLLDAIRFDPGRGHVVQICWDHGINLEVKHYSTSWFRSVVKIPDVIHVHSLLSVGGTSRHVRAISGNHVQALFIPLLGERLSYQNALLTSGVNAEPEACC